MNLPTFWTSWECIRVLKLDILHENPKLLTDFYALIMGPFWPSKNPNLEMVIRHMFVARHVRFPVQFESTPSNNGVKSYG